MIDEKILLQELDEMIKIQQKSVELAAYMKVRNLIKKKVPTERQLQRAHYKIDKNSITQIGRKVKSEKQQLRSLIYLCDCKKRQMEL